MISKQSMLIPKLKLLKEYVSKRKKCPNYIKFFLFKCWAVNIDNFQSIRSDNGLSTYLTSYDIQFHIKDIDLEMGKQIKHSKNRREKFNNLVLGLSEISHYFYTDGSKDNNKCGFGVYSDNVIEISHRINDKSSIYSAEVLAILYALKFIEKNNLDYVAICTDSLSVLKRLKSLGLKSDNNLIIADIIICLNELLIKKNKCIKLIWIPSHVDIEGNDKADKLAKESLHQVNIFYDRLHCDELKPILKTKALSDMIWYIKDYDFGAGLKGKNILITMMSLALIVGLIVMI